MTEPFSAFFEDAKSWRDTVINWEHQVKKTVDDYAPFASLDHAVQKDAIQNSWDARASRKGHEWSCEFELLIDPEGRKLLLITDRGTVGLTGRVLEPEEYYNDMPEEERWARFESLAFTHRASDDAQTLGARGQGKFIFVGASKTNRILYDSLRPDGTYRLGARAVLQTRSPIASWDDEDAIARLAAFHPDLWPLEEPGTRIIIDEPADEVVDAMISGRMAQNIGDTWWPIIQKFGADIRVVTTLSSEHSDTRVTVPDDLILPLNDSGSTKVWHRENVAVDFGGTRFRIKRIHLACIGAAPLRPEIQGVALIRGGMVVTRLPMRFVPAKIATAVTGFVEFDEDLDQALKRVEHPTHYAFEMRRGIGLRVKQWVEDELAKFAVAKLGVGGQPPANVEARRRDAELRALDEINRLARQLGLIGPRGKAGGGTGRNRGGRKSLEPVAVRLDEPVLPTAGSRRVEFGQTLGNIRARVDNNTKDDARVRYSLYLTRGDSVVRRFVPDREVFVGPKEHSPWTEVQDITFNPDDHPAGVYVLRAKLLVLDSPHRPKMYQHTDAFRFWLAEDPPQGGVFEDVEALEYPEDLAKVDAEVVPGKAGGHIFQYNLEHPAYLRTAGDDEELTEYLFALMARELVVVDLESGDPVLFDLEQIETRADQQRRVSLVIGEIMFDHYGHG